MSAARTTDADAPANATYATIATIVTTDRRRRPSRPAQRPDRRRDDRDVPAGDGHDVADAGRREGGRQVAVDPVAQADEDPGRQPGLGLGQDARERLAGRPRSRSRATPGRRRGADRSSGGRAERADGTDPPRYSPYGESGRGRIEPSTGTRSPGMTTGYARQGRRDLKRVAGRGRRQRRGLLAVAR